MAYDTGSPDAADQADLENVKTLKFDNVDTSSGQTVGQSKGLVSMPDGYGGLTWSTDSDVVNPFKYEPAKAQPDSGFFTGLESGKQEAFNNGGGIGFGVGLHESFDVKSLDITAVYDKKLVIEVVVETFKDVLYDHKITVTDAKPFHLELNIDHIKQVTLTPQDGHNQLDPRFSASSNNDMFVIDDLKIADLRTSQTSDSGAFPASSVGHDAVGGHFAVGPGADLGHVHPIA